MTEPTEDDFDAALVVRPMRYRFKTEDEWREIPEPSNTAVIRFFEQWLMIGNRTLERAKLEDEPKNAEGKPIEEPVAVRNERISMNLARQATAAIDASTERCTLVAEVCGNTPDVEELLALSHRVRDGFFGYIVGKLNPQT